MAKLSREQQYSMFARGSSRTAGRGRVSRARQRRNTIANRQLYPF